MFIIKHALIETYYGEMTESLCQKSCCFCVSFVAVEFVAVRYACWLAITRLRFAKPLLTAYKLLGSHRLWPHDLLSVTDLERPTTLAVTTTGHSERERDRERERERGRYKYAKRRR